MSLTNYERGGKSLELLRDGLRPFIERELSAKYGKYWITKGNPNGSKSAQSASKSF